MSSDYSSVVCVGVDLAKTVMHVHAVDADGRLVIAKQISRASFLDWCSNLPPGCVVAMEASTGCHYWARKLIDASLDARLISASFVTPYRMQGKGGKNDANDAEAICEAATRPRMRYVPAKSAEQQAWLAVHRLREGYLKEKFATLNRIQGILLEFGVAITGRPRSVSAEVEKLLSAAQPELPPLASDALERCRLHFVGLSESVKWCDQQIEFHVKNDPVAKRAMSVLGIGPLGASALSATVGDFSQFRNGRQFGAWLGLVPRQFSSGGTIRLGHITKRGDAYLRKLLILGARSALIVAAKHDDPVSVWAVQVRKRVGWSKACVALANKNARCLWRLFQEANDTGGRSRLAADSRSVSLGMTKLVRELEMHKAASASGDSCSEPDRPPHRRRPA